MKKYGLLCAGLIAAATSVGSTANAQEVKDLAIHQPTPNFVLGSSAKTQYPIVFAHGLFGFGSIAGINYFYNILPDLARNGADVWAAQMSTLNSSEIRGEQMLQQVEEILAITGKTKVNLIGHSHGGQSVRYVAGIIPNNVASVTTIGSGNRGAKLADLLEGVLIGGILEAPARAIFDTLVGPVITFASGVNPKLFPMDAKAGMQALGTKKSLEFNQRFPNGVPTTSCGEGAPKVGNTYFYSFNGNSPFNTLRDPSDLSMPATALIANDAGGSDGIAGRCSSRFGKVLRDTYAWNHLDEVNQLFGIRGLFSSDPVQVYREHAQLLKKQGL